MTMMARPGEGTACFKLPHMSSVCFELFYFFSWFTFGLDFNEAERA